jgi:hypothetical protein
MSSIPRFSAEAEAELLLPVPRLYRDGEDVLAYNFEEAYALWNVPGAGKVSVPRGLGWDEPSPVSFRITPGSPGVVPGESYLEWVAFNPTGIRPRRKLIAEIWADKLQLGKLAGLEVMWAAALMPGWARSWNQKNDHKRLTSSPMIGGLQIKRLNAVSVPPSLGWHSYTIGMEFWANRGPYVGNGAHGGQFGYGYYYIGDLVYGNTPLPTIRPVP